MRNVSLIFLIYHVISVSTIHSMAVPPALSSIEVVTGTTEADQIAASIANKINIDASDEITQESFRDIINENAKKKLPTIIVQLQTSAGAHNYYHYVSWTSFQGLSKTRDWQGNIKNPFNRINIMQPVKLYYIFSENDPEMHYLTDSNYNTRNTPYDSFIAMIINNVTSGSPITEQDINTNYLQFIPGTSSEEQKRTATFITNYFAHYPDYLIEAWPNHQQLIDFLSQTYRFRFDLLKALIEKDAPNDLMEYLANNFKNRINPEQKREIAKLAHAKGKPDPFGEQPIQPVRPISPPVLAEQGIEEIYPPAIPTLQITQEEIGTGKFVNKVNLSYEDPLVNETIEALIKKSKASKNPFILAKMVVKQGNQVFHYIYDAEPFLKGDIARNIDDGTFKDPLSNLFGRIYYYYIFDPEDNHFIYLTNGNYDKRAESSLATAFDVFIYRLLKYLIYNPSHLTTPPALSEPIVQEIEAKIKQLEQTPAFQRTHAEDRELFNLHALRQRLPSYRIPFENYLNGTVSMALNVLFNMPEEKQAEERERIANFIVNCFAHYPEYAINAYQKNYYELLDFLANATQFYPKFLVELIKNRNAPNDLINRMATHFMHKMNETTTNAIADIARKNNRNAVVDILMGAQIPPELPPRSPLLPIRPPAQPSQADLKNLYNQLQVHLNQLQQLHAWLLTLQRP